MIDDTSTKLKLFDRETRNCEYKGFYKDRNFAMFFVYTK